jgi:hypothetical protein
MKGMSSKDGKMHGNVQMIDRYNESKGHKPQRPHESGGESGGAHEPMGMDEMKQVVSEHGPAHKIEINHEEGQSRVTSHHEDGHKHTAVFGGGGDEHNMGDAAEHHHAMAHALAAHAGGVHDSQELHSMHSGNQEEDVLERAGDRDEIESAPNKKHMGGGFMSEYV